MSFNNPFCNYEGCTNWREGSTNYCATHNAGFRKMSRDIAKPMKEQKPIKKQSDERKKENSVYITEARKWLVGRDCEICIYNGVIPPNKANQVHHKKGRTNDLLLEKKYWCAVCSGCHTFITEHSHWAIENGFSILRSI